MSGTVCPMMTSESSLEIVVDDYEVEDYDWSDTSDIEEES